MKKITANKNTKLKKRPIDSSLLDSNQFVEVPKNKFYFAESISDSENGHKEVKLGYGAGSWHIWPEHWDGLSNLIKMDKNNPIKSIIESSKSQDLNLKTQWAYIIATAYWETNRTFEAVKEAYWLSEEWRRNNLRYYPYYGRGIVQTTWKYNYQRYSDILKIDLVNNPDKALDPDISLFILTHGFKYGVFTGRKLEDYVNSNKTDFLNARRCINGTDKAKEIADIANDFLNKI